MGGSTDLGIIPKKTYFYCFPLVTWLLKFFQVFSLGDKYFHDR